MDPCTQGLLGAVLSASIAKKKQLKTATFAGGIGGIAPDLDILIQSSNDPLLFIEYHRHFTHSLFFAPFGGILVTLFLYVFLKHKISFKYLYLFTTLGFFSHGLLDSCTSYGTTLYWPISNDRVAWNIISIIDPVYTLSLIISAFLCLKYKSIILVRIGLFSSFIYLALGYIKHQKISNYIYSIAEQRGHKIERILLNPTIGNNILWRTIYKFENFYYINAVHMPVFKLPKFKNGIKLKVIDKETIFPELGKESVQRIDIRRFSYFSQNYIYLHPSYDNVIADLRYGTLPYDDKSLWGIKINSNNQESHIEFLNLRKFEKRDYSEFWSLLKGNF